MYTGNTTYTERAETMKTRKRTQKIKKYSKQFCDQVRQDFPQLMTLSKTKYPTIKCFTLWGRGEKKDYLKEDVNNLDGETMKINGFYNCKNKTVEIYAINKRTSEELKETTRHECLHFILHDAGLSFNDENDVFLLLAIKYNAFPYGLLKRTDIKEMIDKAEQGAETMREVWKIFYNAKTGKEYTAYTMRGTFEGEEKATAELIAAERGIDRKDIKTRIERR